jgi:hypothetical protein
LTRVKPRECLPAEGKIDFVFLQDVDEAVRAVLEPRRESRETG